MKLGLTTALAGILAAALLVPAVGAKPGNGNGNGPPAWAGGAHGQESSQKPGLAVKEARQAENAARKAEKAAQRAERRAARQAAHEDMEKPANPARACKAEREELGDDAFAEAYGTNANKANAFGKCVSEKARDRGSEEPADEEEAAAGDEEVVEEEAPADDEQGEPEESTSIVAFLSYLWPFI